MKQLYDMKEQPMQKISPNITAGMIAKKNGMELPSAIKQSYDAVNSRIDQLNEMAGVPSVFKKARLAKTAKSHYGKLVDTIANYENEIIQFSVEHNKKLENAVKPKDAAEAIEFSGWQAAMFQSGKERASTLAKSDEKMARAALRLPKGLAETVGIDTNSPLLKDKVLPGFTEERERFDSLHENVKLLLNNLEETVAPLFESPEVVKAVSDSEAIGVLR